MREYHGVVNSTMDIVLLIKSFLGLIVVLGILLFLLLKGSSKKKKKSVDAKKSVKPQKKGNAFESLDTLVKVIKDKKSSTKELKEALDKIIKYHGKIHPKLGVRAHPDFNIYGEIILRICHHPNTSKDLIINFDRDLEEKNKEYKREINDFLTKGLETRGI